MKLDDGSKMRRATPSHTPAVDNCLTQFREVVRRMDAGERFFRQNALLAAELELLSLGELKVYYREMRKMEAAAHAAKTMVHPEPPVSWQ